MRVFSFKNGALTTILGIVMDPFCIVMELEEDSLYDFARNWNTAIDWSLRVRIAVDLAEAIAFLHGIHLPLERLQ